MSPYVVVVNPKVKHNNTIQVLAAMLKFRNLYSPPGKYKCHNICRFFFFFFPRDFMDPTMDNTKHILNYLMPIIERVNPEVHDYMQQ